MINENFWRHDVVLRPSKIPFKKFKEYFNKTNNYPWGSFESDIVQTLCVCNFLEIANFGIPVNKTETAEIFIENLEEDSEIDNFPIILNFKDRPSICMFFYVEENELNIYVPIHGNNIHPLRCRPFKIDGMLDEIFVTEQGFRGCRELPKPKIEDCLLDFENSKKSLLECLSF